MHRSTSRSRRRIGLSLAAFLPALLLAAACPAQAPAPSGARLKAIWEPVNYPEDLDLTDVFFVTADVGYVSGEGGTILKTTDGGASWTPQLGGDPGSQERPVRHLRFVSERVGWATQVTGTHTNLFRTRDGESWDQAGTIEEHYTDLAFTSETDGVFAHNEYVYRTQDGGRTWRKVYTCRAKAEIAGLTRELKCQIMSMHFASPATGFAVAYASEVALVLKTEDGGSSWNVLTVFEGDLGRNSGVFFLDENTGYVRLYSGKSYRTSDGGRTWSGMPATALGSSIRFADPEVGWSFRDPCVGMGCANAALSYTSDGGRRWASRSFPLPAAVKALSFPRRDVAYVIGAHGMIFRYRLVPEATPVSAKAIAAIPMPALDVGVIQQLAQAEQRLDSIEAVLEKSHDGVTGGSEPGGGVSWVEANVPQQFPQLETTVESLSAGLPALGRRHRNLNLVMEGLKLLGELTGEGGGLKDAFAGLRKARDADSVSASLANLHAQLDAAKSSVASFQSARKPGT